MSRGRQYSAEFKREAVALVTPDRPWRAVAAELGVPEGTFWRWVLAHREASAGSTGAASPTSPPVDPAAYQAALQRIADLEREVEFLGKASAFFARKVHP
jgi:transposase